jgi:hypothetical protein
MRSITTHMMSQVCVRLDKPCGSTPPQGIHRAALVTQPGDISRADSPGMGTAGQLLERYRWCRCISFRLVYTALMTVMSVL